MELPASLLLRELLRRRLELLLVLFQLLLRAPEDDCPDDAIRDEGEERGFVLCKARPLALQGETLGLLSPFFLLPTSSFLFPLSSRQTLPLASHDECAKMQCSDLHALP